MNYQERNRVVAVIAIVSISLMPVHITLAIANVKPWAQYAGIACIGALIGGFASLYIADKIMCRIRIRRPLLAHRR